MRYVLPQSHPQSTNMYFRTRSLNETAIRADLPSEKVIKKGNY